MALYALASGFLNAYNRSEAAKKQAAAEQAKFEREQSTILAAEERKEARQKARDALKRKDDQKNLDFQKTKFEFLKTSTAEEFRLKQTQMEVAKRKEATNAVLDLFKTRMNAYSRGLTNEDPKIARTSQSSLNKLSKQYDILIASIARGEPINIKAYLNIANSIQSDLENNVAKERVGEIGIDTGVGDLETFENTNDSIQTGFDKDNPSVVLGG